jgi:hypothetical protein
MTFYDAIRYVHILAGAIALAAFWTAAILRKGSPAHRGVGRTFMVTMLALSVTGVVIALAAFRRGERVTGAFLLYLVLITVTACWLGWRAVRDKRDIKRYTGTVYRSLAWANIVAGGVILSLGVRYEELIVAGVSSVGLIVGPLMLRFARHPPTDRQWWLARHYGAILGAGVATHVAFLNIGLSRLLPELGVSAQRLSWFLPFALALIARRWLDRKYSPRLPRREAAADAPGLRDAQSVSVICHGGASDLPRNSGVRSTETPGNETRVSRPGRSDSSTV